MPGKVNFIVERDEDGDVDRAEGASECGIVEVCVHEIHH